MKIGFTGTREGMTLLARRTFMDLVRELVESERELIEFHHGDCVGADKEAFEYIASRADFKTVAHPPIVEALRAHTRSDEIRPAADYLKRNRNIVDETDLLIACPKGKEEELRSGTWATVRYARYWHKPRYLIFPDGTLKRPKRCVA